AVPSPLRPTLRFQRSLRQWIDRAWPGYGWLFSTFNHMQTAQREAGTQMEVTLLRLGLAERLCQAQDYDDQASGINDKSSALSELAYLADKQKLSPEQRTIVKQRQQEHRRTFADFPRSRGALFLTTKGLAFVEYPGLDDQDAGAAGPMLLISGLGGWGFSF